jgi:hypothetical protein
VSTADLREGVKRMTTIGIEAADRVLARIRQIGTTTQDAPDLDRLRHSLGVAERQVADAARHGSDGSDSELEQQVARLRARVDEIDRLIASGTAA